MFCQDGYTTKADMWRIVHRLIYGRVPGDNMHDILCHPGNWTARAKWEH